MFFQRPRRPSIDEHTTKMVVGVIAVSIGLVTTWASDLPDSLTSISQSCFAGDWSRNVFVGFLYAIAAFLMSYNGETVSHFFASKTASCAAFGVAMFPCDCRNESIPACAGAAAEMPSIHYACAAVMFSALAYFCLEFYRDARKRAHVPALWRARIYVVCFVAIVVSIVSLGLNAVLAGDLAAHYRRFVYAFELLALEAFGISWFVASHVLPGITRADERHKLIG
ncbi:MAG TPA: hypothetical protein VMU33_03260 [Burkholderiaceae bacterium]|nr:hypothetical protein [Burkholderiaceae bacterium]